MGKNQPKTQAERFEEVRATYATKEDFRDSIKAENVKTLRNSAKEFEINLEGRDSKDDILDTIVDTVYADQGNANARAGAGVEGSGEGVGGDDGDNTYAPETSGPTPAHDDKTQDAAQNAADKREDGEDGAPSDAANKAAMDGTTESAAEVPGAGPHDVIHTNSPANPNEKWTEPNDEKRQRLSAGAIAAREQEEAEKQK